MGKESALGATGWEKAWARGIALAFRQEPCPQKLGAWLRQKPWGKVWARGPGQFLNLAPARLLLIVVPTFERRLQDRGRFGCQEELLGMAAEGPALLRRDDELPGEARSVTDIIVLVVLGQTQHVLGQQLGLGDKR